jgi:uncharacterized protein (TIGR02147 family)
MKPIFEYTDYRLLLRDFYEGRKMSMPGFSYREFSKIAGYKSPVFIKLVIEGQANLSEAGVERIGEALGYSGRERDYFRALVAFNQEKKSAVKNLWLKEMREAAAQGGVKVLNEGQYDYYKNWYNSAVRELICTMPAGTSPAVIGKMLIPQVSAAKVQKSISLLLENNLICKTESGYKQCDPLITTGAEVVSLAVREHHKQMAQLGLDSIETIDRTERDISGMTLGVSQKAFIQIREELAAFRRKITQIVDADSTTQNVYRLNLQLFPISSNITVSGGYSNEV